MNPAKAEIDAVSKSPSTMPTQTSARASRAKIPAKTESRRLPQKPMTLRKVLDTIDPILLKNLSVVKLDDVDALVSAIGRVLVQSELQTSLLICRDGRPRYPEHLGYLRSAVSLIRQTAVVDWILHLSEI